jgi:hypothetical protein
MNQPTSIVPATTDDSQPPTHGPVFTQTRIFYDVAVSPPVGDDADVWPGKEPERTQTRLQHFFTAAVPHARVEGRGRGGSASSA